MIEADTALGARVLDALAAMSHRPPGHTREAYGPGEQAAHDLVTSVAAELSLSTEVDAAGNLYATLAGRGPEAPAWIIGSHLDTVPHGGNFDGGAGVAGALAAVSGLVGANVVPPRPVTVVVLRAEESTWFPVSYIGSRTALGTLPPEALDARRADTGRTLADHMRDQGFAPDRVAQGAARLTRENVRGFVELHIEQGPVLEDAALPVALVSGISGSFRYRDARCLGQYAHSGAVPRGSRRDAVLGTAELAVRLDALWEELDGEGVFVRITLGQFATDPDEHAFSKVSGDVAFCIDVRSDDPDVLARVEAALANLVVDIEARRRVRFALGPRTGSTPARMSGALQARLAALAVEAGLNMPVMPSGAGHDAASFAAAGIPAAMLFIRNQNGSHNPQEDMRIEDFAVAATLLARLIAE